MAKDVSPKSAVSSVASIQNKSASSGVVSIKSNVALSDMPGAVSALIKLGISAQVAVRGTHTEIVSAMNVLTTRFNAVSGMVSLRGVKPAGQK